MDCARLGRAASTALTRHRHTMLLFMALIGSCSASSGCNAPREVVPSYPETFAGVGLELTAQGTFPTVVRTLAGSPAARRRAMALATDVASWFGPLEPPRKMRWQSGLPAVSTMAPRPPGSAR